MKEIEELKEGEYKVVPAARMIADERTPIEPKEVIKALAADEAAQALLLSAKLREELAQGYREDSGPVRDFENYLRKIQAHNEGVLKEYREKILPTLLGVMAETATMFKIKLDLEKLKEYHLSILDKYSFWYRCRQDSST